MTKLKLRVRLLAQIEQSTEATETATTTTSATKSLLMTLNKRFYTVDFCAFLGNFARCIALDLCAKRYNDTSDRSH